MGSRTFALVSGILVTVAVWCNRPGLTAAPPSTRQIEGCTVLPYEGSPLTPEQAEDWGGSGTWDVRGGILCRSRVGSKLPLFTFRFLGKPDNTLGDIEVSEGNSPVIIQRIRYPRYDYQRAGLESPEDALKALDANFDGYKDLQVYVQCGAVGNCTYDYYLYDPKTNRFVRNAFLSRLTMPQFNSSEKTVTSYWHVSAGDGGHETYRYEAGQYVPIREVEDSWDRKSNTVTEKAYVLREGRLVLVRSKTSPF